MNKKAKKTPEDGDDANDGNNQKDGSQKKVYGDPSYSADEDIYSQGEKEELIDSDEDAKKAKTPKRTPKDRLSGDDLDVPGSELDDDDEKIGEEDEENNYYSLGGDDHDDLEEDKGD
jgi:hypothetical protein